MSDVADVVVIGGGVMGASVAYHLAQGGVRRVVVVEKRFLAAGATGKSPGLVRMHYDNEPESRLAWISFAYFRNWSEVIGGDCGVSDSRWTGKRRGLGSHGWEGS